MSQDIHQNKNLKVRKFSWKSKKTFKTYNEAVEYRSSLNQEGFEYLKIRRCGPRGTQFKVLIGTSINTKNNTKTNKKGNKNAN